MKTSSVAGILAMCLSTYASPLGERNAKCPPRTVTNTQTITHNQIKFKTKTKIVTQVLTLPVSTVTATVLESNAAQTVTSLSTSVSTLSVCPSLSSTTLDKTILSSPTPPPSTTTSRFSTSSTSTSTMPKSTKKCNPVVLPYPFYDKNFIDCGNSTDRNSSYYYLQISGTGTKIDGSLASSDLWGGGYNYFEPYNTTGYTYTDGCNYPQIDGDPTGPMPFTYQDKDNTLRDGWGEPLAAYTWVLFWGSGYGNILSCDVTGPDKQLNCHATDNQTGIVYDHFYLYNTDSQPSMNRLSIGQHGSSQKAVTLKLVSPCAS